MNGDIAAVLSELPARIAVARSRGLNEQNTKASFIEPMLRALGWNTGDYTQVAHEYRVRTGNPADYALLDAAGRPLVLVEAKQLNVDVTDVKWAGEVLGYAGALGTRWLVLTNGDDYRIYDADAKGDANAKLFRSVRLSQEDPQAGLILSLLTKAAIEDGELSRAVDAELASRHMASTLERLFRPEPDKVLVRLVRGEAKDRTHGEVAAWLKQVKLTFPGPSLPRSVTVETRPEIVSLTALGGERTRAARGHLAMGLSFPIGIEANYRGSRLEATLLDGGRVSFNGQIYHSPSLAGRIAAGTISMNGWTFWYYRNERGELRPIDDLRQKDASPRV